MPTEKELKEMERNYVKGSKDRTCSWANCPVCKSRSLEGGEYDGEGNRILQKIECLDCGSTWTDVYTLTGFMDLKIKE